MLHSISYYTGPCYNGICFSKFITSPSWSNTSQGLSAYIPNRVTWDERKLLPSRPMGWSNNRCISYSPFDISYHKYRCPFCRNSFPTGQHFVLRSPIYIILKYIFVPISWHNLHELAQYILHTCGQCCCTAPCKIGPCYNEAFLQH